MKKHARSNSMIYLLERTLRQLRGLLHKEFAKNGLRISVDQWLVLKQVAEMPEQNLSHVAAHTAKDPASVTRIVSLLQTQKLLTKQHGKNDQRSYRLSVTPAGKKMLTQCAHCVERFRRTALKGLTQEELNLQKKVLDMLSQNCEG